MNQKNQNIDINSTMAVTSAILISVIGPSVFIVQPGFVQGLVELLNFTEQEAGLCGCGRDVGYSDHHGLSNLSYRAPKLAITSFLSLQY